MKKEYTKPTLEAVSFTSDTAIAENETLTSAITAKLSYQQKYSTVTYY
ncbi:MAG: hypothetical protein LUC92_03585 [Clostridiales bacterium]|nr:hypothetical protein [Clostridiales bacterium]